MLQLKKLTKSKCAFLAVLQTALSLCWAQLAENVLPNVDVIKCSVLLNAEFISSRELHVYAGLKVLTQ